jgi:hypothetical protein
MMNLPSWLPQTPKPSALSGWDKTWGATSPDERRKSFLFFDLPVLFISIGLMLYGCGIVS